MVSFEINIAQVGMHGTGAWYRKYKYYQNLNESEDLTDSMKID